MSQNVDALIWRAGASDAYGDVLTLEALETMAKALKPGDEITLDFDFRNVIGHLVQAWIQGNDLYATVSIDDLYAQDARDGNLAVRPGFRIAAQHMDADGVRIIDKIDITHVSLTPNPLPLPGEAGADS